MSNPFHAQALNLDNNNNSKKSYLAPVTWAQDGDRLWISVTIKGVEKENTLVHLGKEHFNFETTTSDGRKYTASFRWYREVLEDGSILDSMERLPNRSGFLFIVKKAIGCDFWPRLLREEGKTPSWLKIDWKRWKSQDSNNDDNTSSTVLPPELGKMYNNAAKDPDDDVPLLRDSPMEPKKKALKDTDWGEQYIPSSISVTLVTLTFMSGDRNVIEDKAEDILDPHPWELRFRDVPWPRGALPPTVWYQRMLFPENPHTDLLAVDPHQGRIRLRYQQTVQRLVRYSQALRIGDKFTWRPSPPLNSTREDLRERCVWRSEDLEALHKLPLRACCDLLEEDLMDNKNKITKPFCRVFFRRVEHPRYALRTKDSVWIYAPYKIRVLTG